MWLERIYLVNRTGNLNSRGALSCIVLSKTFLHSAKYSYLQREYRKWRFLAQYTTFPLVRLAHSMFLSSSNTFSFKAKIIKDLDF